MEDEKTNETRKSERETERRKDRKTSDHRGYGRGKRERSYESSSSSRGPPPPRPTSPSLRHHQKRPPDTDTELLRHSSRDSKRSRIDVVEKTEKYEILHDHTIEPDSFEVNHPDLGNVPILDLERMLKGGFCKEEYVTALWHQKNRMDAVFDSGYQKYYYDVRDRIFPQDKKGSTKFRNRAGDKLDQVDESVSIFPKSEITFVDICGGPGAFSQLLLDKPGRPSPIGYGITLEESLSWYRDLLDHTRFTVCRGSDGTGNVYIPENLNSVAEKLQSDGKLEKVNIVVSDGGFEIKKNEKGEHMENYQELYSGRIILSELLLTMKILQPGGNFVCKLFDAFSCITQSVIYITTQIFSKVYVVKPLRSRIVNSEKYLVGKNLQKGKNFEFLKTIVEELHRRCEEDASPRSIIPREIMFEDINFLKSSHQACEEICRKQTRALALVMDKVEEELNLKQSDAIQK